MPKSNDQASAFLFYWKAVLGNDDAVPQPVGEFKFDPEREWRIDWSWPIVKVGVEVDGGQWAYGGGRHAGDDDKVKTNSLVEQGWLVFHYSPQMLSEDPTGCVLQVARTVAELMARK